MYDDKDTQKTKISVENTLELLYIRIRDEVPKQERRSKLDEEIRAIFGFIIYQFDYFNREKDKTAEGKDVEITFE
jgi:hypothetical protein